MWTYSSATFFLSYPSILLLTLTFRPGVPASPLIPGNPGFPWVNNNHNVDRNCGAAVAKSNTITVITYLCPSLQNTV